MRIDIEKGVFVLIFDQLFYHWQRKNNRVRNEISTQKAFRASLFRENGLAKVISEPEGQYTISLVVLQKKSDL